MEKKSIYIKNITMKFGEIFYHISYIIPSIYLIASTDNFLNWLKTGVWEKYSVSMLFKDIGFSIKLTNWVEIDKIIEFYVNSSAFFYLILPFSFFCFFFSVFLLIISDQMNR